MTSLSRRPAPALRAAIPCLALCLGLGLAPAALVAQLNENFDGVTRPDLPPGWTSSISEVTWISSTTFPDTGPNSAFVNTLGRPADRALVSPAIAIPVGAPARLSFRNNYFFIDGGVLEISIAGGPFQDITTAGGSFVSGGYTGPISAIDNPLLGRDGWIGNSGGYVTCDVNLPGTASGNTIRMRWRMGTNYPFNPARQNADPVAQGFSGWTVDTVSITLAGFAENFDTVNPPALPAGWTGENVGDWFTVDDLQANTPPNVVHTWESNVPSDRQLTSPSVAIPAGGGTLSFFHAYNMEFDVDLGPLDYGTLEIAIGGGPFQEFVAAGGVFVTGGYNFGNRWSGSTAGVFGLTSATLPPSAAGQSVRFRWRFVTDNTDVNGQANDGWRVDTVSLLSCPPTAAASAANPTICSNSSTTLTGSGGDTCLWTPATWLSNPTSCTPTVVPNGEVGTIDYTLTVTKTTCPPGSNTDTATVSVTSQAIPVAVASATRTSICPGSSTLLRGSGGTTCVWTPAAGLANPLSCNTAATPSSTTTYSLRVASVCGVSTNTANVTIEVTARPPGPEVDAPAVVSAGDVGLVASIVSPSPGSTYTWVFTPPDAATVITKGLFSITFNANLEGPLTLSVIEKNGACISEATQVAIAVGPPCFDPQPPSELSIRVSGSPDAQPTGIDFLDLSWTAPENPPAFFLWALNGNPEQATTATAVLGAPPTGSNDPITLQVRSACSEELASEAAEVTTTPSAPVASFEFGGPIDVATPVVFTDTSVPAATSWLWLFGDGSDPETTQSVSHSFAEGTYTVFLIASNGAGSSAASRVLEVSAGAPPPAVLAGDTRAFDAGVRGRRRLNAVSLAGKRPVWLHVRSGEQSREAVAFLRFLDAAGALVLERRLSVSPGQEAVFDLGAYGLDGIYDLELVSFRALSASVVDTRSRSTREVRRPQR